MNRKSKLKINKGEEFKIAIKDIKDGDGPMSRFSTS